MKQIEKTFIGKGEVKGFSFTQIQQNDYAYIYEVDTGNGIHYEVFQHRINKQFNCVSYPRSKSFGVWAWSYNTKEDAYYKFQTLTIAAQS